MKFIRSLTLVILFALSLATIPAAAGNDAQIILTVVESKTTGTNTFAVSGSPVGEGVICSGGSVDTIGTYGGSLGGGHDVTIIMKNFVCSDGSGTFIVEFKINKPEHGNVSWSIEGGDGAYVGLSGRGSWKSTSSSVSVCTNVYQGSIRGR